MPRMMRRVLPLVPAVLAWGAAVSTHGPAAPEARLRYGVAAFGAVDPLAQADVVARAGYDYIEPALSKTVALAPGQRDAALATLARTGLRVETMNWFLPGSDIRVVGPDVDAARIREYLETSLALAERLGAKVIVFGSPGARTVPDGFPHDKAWEQLKEFLRTCGDVIQAHNYGMVIGIEALRKPETNIVNSVAEALKLAREVNHPKIRIIVDFYHLAFEHEDPNVILGGRDMIVHLQIADPHDRTFPVSDAGEPRYRAFFANLRKIGYNGRISIEANSDNVGADAKASLAFLKKMAAAD
jgi:D-psicose/D-tagatose/L-ribulose 3-epimerase